MAIGARRENGLLFDERTMSDKRFLVSLVRGTHNQGIAIHAAVPIACVRDEHIIKYISPP